MKKIAIAIVAVFALGFTSCKKDYVCQCSKIRTANGATLTTDADKYTFKDTRTRAESKCNDQETTGKDLAGDYSLECQIK